MSALTTHYASLVEKLTTEAAKIQEDMRNAVATANPAVAEIHNNLLRKTIENLNNLREKLDAKKTSKIEITHTKSTPILDGNSAGCATHGCKCCRTMSRKVRIHSSSNHKSFYTPKHTNCNTMGIIYLLECSKCTTRNQYVGQTKRTLAQRLGGHRAASQIKHNLPIYKHFNTRTDHNFERDVRLTVLEKPPIHSLDSRESYWISTLDTVHPKGLNSRYE